jgi:hypothetical protein
MNKYRKNYVLNKNNLKIYNKNIKKEINIINNFLKIK